MTRCGCQGVSHSVLECAYYFLKNNPIQSIISNLFPLRDPKNASVTIHQPPWRIVMSERKKSLALKDPKTPVAVASSLAEVTGASDREVAAQMAQQVISVLPLANLDKEERLRRIGVTFNLLRKFEPQNELEGLLASQMIGVHETVMECLEQSRLPAQNSTGRDMNLKHAVKFMGLFTKQLEALDRLRGKGQQQMTVERVNVESGGQAIVGNVTQTRNGQENCRSEKSVLKEVSEHESDDIVNSGSNKKNEKKRTAPKKRA